MFLQAATISGADAPLVETAFQYGKNLGLAFQFVDDLLDFVSSSETMGKPAAADLKLGLATAPVLFACEKVSESLLKPFDNNFQLPSGLKLSDEVKFKIRVH